jgi:hypothetical protein
VILLAGMPVFALGRLAAQSQDKKVFSTSKKVTELHIMPNAGHMDLSD